MRMQVYSIHDQAVKAFLLPFFVRARGEAIRSFTAAVNDEKSQFNRNYGDYTLFYLGDYDDTEGVFYSAQPQPEPVVRAGDVLEDTVFTQATRSPTPRADIQ